MFGGSDEVLSRILSIMTSDLRTLVDPLAKSLTKTGRIRKNCRLSPELLMNYGMMMDTIHRILKIFHTMSESDINRLLEDRVLEGSVLYFNEIEKLSDRIIMDMMEKMMRFVKS